MPRKTHRPEQWGATLCQHEIDRELKAMSDCLDQHLDLLNWIAADVKQRNVDKAVPVFIAPL